MDESEYLGRVRALWARAWPVDTPREPHYPIGRAPLTDYLRHWARTTPDKPAIHFYGHDTTFAQLDDLSLTALLPCSRSMALARATG